MGVTGLWNILGELAERKPLKYLSGKRVAVDLSGWVVQAMLCPGLNTSKNPHLRNLFFRVSRLLQDGALPIFIMEGVIPAIKMDTFKERNQHRPEKYCSDDKTISRSSFNQILSQCHDLLDTLGVPCIKSSGEAEAFCGYLSANGVVDGVITEDNDAFLYGADPVYREFTMDRADPHINLYSLKSKKNKLQLNRKKLIALALLLGCDYGKKGVPGVGKDSALKLLSELPDCDLLQRFKEWKEESETNLFPGYDANIKKLSHCSRCEHLGSLAKHKKSGCETCDSKFTCYLSNEANPCFCSWHKSNEVGLKRKTELKIYNASKKVPHFPNIKVIEEYLCFSDSIPDENTLEWKCPDMQKFQEKAYNYWSWTPENSFDKCFPIITSWHQFKAARKTAVEKESFLFKPSIILKETRLKGEAIFKVQWEKIDTTHCTTNSESMCTNEYVDRFSEAYPEMAEVFYNSLEQKKPKSPTKKSKSKTANPDSDIQKMTDFFAYENTTSSGGSKKIEELPHCDNVSKRCIEDFNSDEPCEKKKQCL